MKASGKLLITEKNEFGLFDTNKGEHIYLSNEIDKLREKKIHIKITDDRDNVLFNEKGFLNARRAFKGIYDIFIENSLETEYDENSHVLNEGVNLTEFLFNHTFEKINVTIKELTQDESEVTK